MKPNAVQAEMLVKLDRQFPDFSEFLDEWRSAELEQMPYAANTNLDVLRGRVQTLTEMQRFLGRRK